jgi:structural maintenance of chromosome 4
VEIAKNTKEVTSLREKSSGISNQIKELQNKILEVGGVKLRAIQSKFSTTKGLLDLANDAITKAEVGQAKAKHDVEKLKKAIDSNTQKLEEVEEELAVVGADLEASERDLRMIKEKVQEAQDASADEHEGLQASKAELDEKLTDINAFRKLEVGFICRSNRSLLTGRWTLSRRSRIITVYRRIVKTSSSTGGRGMMSLS